MNKRGAALILAYAAIMVLTILASVFLSSIISENNLVRRYQSSSQAFWIAEAGLANAYHSWCANSNYPGETNTPLGEGTYTVTKTPVNPQVTVTGTVGTVQRTIHAQFVGIPRAFDSVLSAGRNLSVYTPSATQGSLTVNGNTRYSRDYLHNYDSSVSFTPNPQKVAPGLTAIPIPDYNGNGTADEFDDFVQFGRQAIAAYPPEQTVYIKTNGVAFIDSSANLQGKKVVFVEGSCPYCGEVIMTTGPFPTNTTGTQDLTIISTGEILDSSPVVSQANRVSTISWGGYYVYNWFSGRSLSGVHYSHDQIFFANEGFGQNVNTGNYISNGDLSLSRVVNWENPPTTFTYSDRAAKGDLPPGFALLSDNNSSNKKLINWQE